MDTVLGSVFKLFHPKQCYNEVCYKEALFFQCDIYLHIDYVEIRLLKVRLHFLSFLLMEGWLGVVNVSGIVSHLGIQLIMASSWARLSILVAGKGKGRFIFISSVSSLSFLFLFLSCLSLSSPLLSLLSLFSLSLGEDTK